MILDQFKIDDKVAIVTGSAQGLGQGMALGLAEAGADVALVDILDMSDTQKQIEALGRRCVAIQADLTDKSCVPVIIDTTVKELGGAAALPFRFDLLHQLRQAMDIVGTEDQIEVGDLFQHLLPFLLGDTASDTNTQVRIGCLLFS